MHIIREVKRVLYSFNISITFVQYHDESALLIKMNFFYLTSKIIKIHKHRIKFQARVNSLISDNAAK